MVISVGGQAASGRSCAGPSELFAAHPALEDGARELVKEKVVSLRPEGVLYARQKVVSYNTVL